MAPTGRQSKLGPNYFKNAEKILEDRDYSTLSREAITYAHLLRHWYSITKTKTTRTQLKDAWTRVCEEFPDDPTPALPEDESRDKVLLDWRDEHKREEAIAKFIHLLNIQSRPIPGSSRDPVRPSARPTARGEPALAETSLEHQRRAQSIPGEFPDDSSITEPHGRQASPRPSSDKTMSRQDVGFSNAQVEHLTDIIDRLLDKRERDRPIPPLGPLMRPQSPPYSSKEEKHEDTGGHFRPQEIGYFYPDLPEKEGAGDVVTIHNDVFMRDVHIFIDRARDNAATRGERTVVKHLSLCFRGAALTWYTSAVSEVEKRGIRTGPLSDLTDMLQKQFQPPKSTALNHLRDSRYSLQDAARRRSVTAYTMDMIKAGKSADIPNLEGQLTFAWEGIDAALTSGLQKHDGKTTLTEFCRRLEDQKNSWQIIAERQLSWNQAVQGQARIERELHSRRNIPQRGQYHGRPFQGSGFQGNWQSFQNRNTVYGQNPQFSGGKLPQSIQPQPAKPTPAPLAPAPKPAQPELKGKDPYRQGRNDDRYKSGTERFRQSSRDRHERTTDSYRPTYGRNDRADRSDRRSQRAYWAENKEEADELEDCNAYIAEDQWEEPHLDKYDDETGQNDDPWQDVYANYVEALHTDTLTVADEKAAAPKEHLCRNCREAFLSRNKMMAHVRSCKRKRPKETVTLPTAPEPPAPASRQTPPKSAIVPMDHGRIVTARNKPISLGKGTCFRGYRYATCRAALSATGQTDDICLDSGNAMTMIRRDFLSTLPDWPKKIRTNRAIQVKGIGRGTSMTEEYAVLDLFLPGTAPDGVRAVAHVRFEAHIMDNMRPNILVGNDVLVPNEMDLILSAGVCRIASCESIEVPIEIKEKRALGPQVKREVKLAQSTKVAAYSIQMVQVEREGDNLPKKRDYLFAPDMDPTTKQRLGTMGGPYGAMVDASWTSALLLTIPPGRSH